MILNTGQRTDIPAFFSEWFMNRVNEGFVLVRNPYNQSAVTRYEISPGLVDLIGFCTKNPAPMLPHVNGLFERGYGQFWHVTITPYGRDIEPGVPDKRECLDTFKRLSSLVGTARIAWRYDPIFLSEKYSAEYHLRAFEKMAGELRGWTDSCVISFLDLFPKVRRNFPEARAPSEEEKMLVGKTLIKIAAERGITVRTCGEGNALAPFGADTSGCMTRAVYERAAGGALDFPAFTPARTECACYLSCDIGAYSSCRHFCRYCYANADRQAIERNFRAHDPSSPFLIGGHLAGDTVHQAAQKSWRPLPQKEIQRELF